MGISEKEGRLGTFLAVLFLLSLSVFMRFSRLTELFPFDLDAEYLSQLGQTIAHDFHLIWIGVSAGSTNYYLGPGYVYLTGLVLWLSNTNPLALTATSSFIGVVTTLLVWRVGSELFGKRAGFIAGLLYAGSAYAALFDRRWWPPATGLAALLILWTLERSRKNTWWLVGSAFLAGISLHLHLSLIVFFPFILYFFIRSWHSLWPWRLLAALLVYFLATLPLTVYDLVHNFDNLKAPFLMLANTAGAGRGGGLHTELVLTMLAKFWDVTPAGALSTLFFAACTLAAIVFCYFKKKARLLSLMLLSYLLLLLVFPGTIQEYYAVTMLPLVAIAVSVALVSINRIFQIALLSCFVVMNVVAMQTVEVADSYAQKIELVQRVARDVGLRPIRLTTRPSYRENGGWHFLFYSRGVPVVTGSSDEFYRWIYSRYMDVSAKPEYTITIDNNQFPNYKIQIEK